MSSWRHSRSLSTVLEATEAASPWHFISFRPTLTLYQLSHPLLNFSHSSSGMPTRSANFFHFWQMTSPVRRTLFAIACETQRSNISVTSGCLVWHSHFAEWSVLFSYLVRHFASCLHQADILGCLSWRFGYMTSKCFAVFVWFSPLAWCQSRILIRWVRVAFSSFWNLGAGADFTCSWEVFACCKGPR